MRTYVGYVYNIHKILYTGNLLEGRETGHLLEGRETGHLLEGRDSFSYCICLFYCLSELS